MSAGKNDRDTRNLSNAEKEPVHRNRMDRLPYSLAEESMPFKRVYEGSCFCEKVKFGISREVPLDAKYCHCKGCQVLHGAPFQWVGVSFPVPSQMKIHFPKIDVENISSLVRLRYSKKPTSIFMKARTS